MKGNNNHQLPLILVAPSSRCRSSLLLLLCIIFAIIGVALCASSIRHNSNDWRYTMSSEEVRLERYLMSVPFIIIFFLIIAVRTDRGPADTAWCIGMLIIGAGFLLTASCLAFFATFRLVKQDGSVIPLAPAESLTPSRERAYRVLSYFLLIVTLIGAILEWTTLSKQFDSGMVSDLVMSETTASFLAAIAVVAASLLGEAYISAVAIAFTGLQWISNTNDAQYTLLYYTRGVGVETVGRIRAGIIMQIISLFWLSILLIQKRQRDSYDPAVQSSAAPSMSPPSLFDVEQPFVANQPYSAAIPQEGYGHEQRHEVYRQVIATPVTTTA